MPSPTAVAALHSFPHWERLDGGSIIVACSGGPDSTALACAVAEFIADAANSRLWQVQAPRLLLWHLDHQLRETSQFDAQFVVRLAARLGARVVVEQVDVERLARERKQNVEATGREQRYTRLLSCCEVMEAEHPGAQAFAFTAHHLDDQAETVLLRLVRGAHLQGLTGIAQEYAGRVYRPWLGLARAQIMDYLRERQQDYINDATNTDMRLARNYLRHEILPLLQRVNPGVSAHLASLAASAAQAVHIADAAIADLGIVSLDAGQLADYLPLAAAPSGSYEAHLAPVPWGASAVFTQFALRRLARHGIPASSRLAAELQSLQHGTIERLSVGCLNCTFISAQRCFILAGVTAQRTPAVPVGLGLGNTAAIGSLIVSLAEADTGGWTGWLETGAREPLSDAKTWQRLLAYLAHSTPAEAAWRCYLKHATCFPLAARTWQTGDRIQLPHGGTKKLTDVFIDAKVPRAFRDTWLVLADASGGIVWVPGLADSVCMALDAATKPAYVVQVTQLTATRKSDGSD